MEYQARGQYFEDFTVGQTLVTTARTITESDIVRFAGLSGDFNQIHIDAAYAADGPFGKRVAHGLLVQSIASGLSVLTGFVERTVLAFRELDCKFSRPVFIGDTIHVTLEVKTIKAVPRLGGGNVLFKYNVLNQDGQTVQRGTWTMLVKSRL